MQKRFYLALIALILISGITYAQSQLVAFLTATGATVELKRVGTERWVPIEVESIVGVGDTIRTLGGGSATIRFFSDESYVTLAPDSMIRIDRLTELGDGYGISYAVLQGSTEQVLDSPEDKPATYEIVSQSVSLLTRSGQFNIIVNEEGATDVLSRAGSVYSVSNNQLLEIPPAYGVRANSDGTLTDVTPAESIEQLSAALDGVAAAFNFDGDILLNVRKGPSRGADSLGTIEPGDIDNVLGISADGRWYRIRYEGGFGWVSGQSLDVTVDTRYLLVFEGSHIESAPDAPAEVIAAAPVTETPAPPVDTTRVGSALLQQYSAEELGVIAKVNKWRVDLQLWPLALNSTLSKMARDQASYLLTLADFPSDPHADRLGRNPRQRAVAQEYQWPFYGRQDRVAVGEVAYVGINSDAAIAYWQQSAIHNATISNPGYREVGIAALPHRLGSLYIIVVGSRPDILPALLDPARNVLYLSTERYRYAEGGNWLTNVSHVQVIPSVLSELNDSSWANWGPTLNRPNLGEFAVVYRDSSERLVIESFIPAEDIALLPENIASLSTVAAAAPPPTPTATPTLALPPVVNFQPVATNNSAPAQPVQQRSLQPMLFPTNTPSR